MSLYKRWQDTLEKQTNESFAEFWKRYSDAEKSIYSAILDKAIEGNDLEVVNFSGKIDELARIHHTDAVIFMGFIDGISESVKEAPVLDDLKEDSEISLDIYLEKLFFNMLKADADYLYTLPQWEQVLGSDKMAEIAREYKRSKTFKREGKKVGRNDPCPCGSGKKYKHCCGR